MNKIFLFAVVVVLTIPIASYSKEPMADLDLLILGQPKLVRIQQHIDIHQQQLANIWVKSFEQLFNYTDRNHDDILDQKEISRLPSARAIRQMLASGFAPPIGSSPTLKEFDTNQDGRVHFAEFLQYYRLQEVGQLSVSFAVLQHTTQLNTLLYKHLDTNNDGVITEKEWKSSCESFLKLDRNDDELVGIGELIPGALYPATTNAVMLSDKPLPTCSVVRLRTNSPDQAWIDSLKKFFPKIDQAAVLGVGNQPPTVTWNSVIKPDGTSLPWHHQQPGLWIDGWCVEGKIASAADAMKKQLINQLESTEIEGRRAGNLNWLIPIADLHNDGTLQRSELDRWLELQLELIKGQVLLTIADDGGLFELLDANHDGALSVRELRDGWTRLKSAGCITERGAEFSKLPRVLLLTTSWGYPKSLTVAPVSAPAWFKAMDRNQDGDISRREFTGTPDQFGRLDADRDGLISPTEAEIAGKTAK